MIIAALLAATAMGPVPSLEETEKLIAERDTELFHEAFGGCDIDHLRTILDPDFRMLHDQGGLVAGTGEAFLAIIADDCASRDPSVYANQRRHVEGSRRVQMLGDWGALEEGMHTFHESQNAGPFQPVGRARYIHSWRWNGETFVLVESLSIDHEAYAGEDH